MPPKMERYYPLVASEKYLTTFPQHSLHDATP